MGGYLDSLGGAGEALGGVIGERYAKPAQDMSDAEVEAAIQALMKLSGPGANDLQVGPSAMQGIHADPRAIAAQMQALERFQRESNSNGLTAEDESKFLQAQDRVAEQARGQRGALMQRFAAQGQSGGMGELAAQLEGASSSANRLNRAGTDMAGQAAMRALEAAAQSGHLGSVVRGQDFGEQAQKASAQDAIAKFNSGARQLAWQDQMKVAEMQDEARMRRAGVYQGKADRTRGQLRGAGRALGGSVGAIGDEAMTFAPSMGSAYAAGGHVPNGAQAQTPREAGNMTRAYTPKIEVGSQDPYQDDDGLYRYGR